MQHGLFILQCTHRQAHRHTHTHTPSSTVTELNIGVKSWLTIYAPPPSVFAQFAFCNIYCKLVFASQYRNSMYVVTLYIDPQLSHNLYGIYENLRVD